MATMRGARLPVGTPAWVEEERSSAAQIVQSEIEEFSFSVRNELDWLNEHMADVFSENQINVAEIFKTPGKLRGKTPRTARKANKGEPRVPLSDVFSATPKGVANPFANALSPKLRATPMFEIAEDQPTRAAQLASSPTRQSPLRFQQRAAESELSVRTDESPEATRKVPLKDADATTTLAQAVPQAPQHSLMVGSPTSGSIEETWQSAKEEQTRQVTREVTSQVRSPVANSEARPAATRTSPVRAQLQSPLQRKPVPSSSPVRSSPRRQPNTETAQKPITQANTEQDPADDGDFDDDVRSPSDGSSPIRPVVRKSSLNFASLPAREPLTHNKSLGPRVSRTSHLDQTRTSYYNRHTGGKSLGNAHSLYGDDNDDMDLDDDATMQPKVNIESQVAAHSKTYTQRLQDQISMLGKSNTNPPPTRQVPAAQAAQPAVAPVMVEVASPVKQVQQAPTTRPQGSPPQSQAMSAPGAFPEDEDDWIAPPTAGRLQSAYTESRPDLTKSYSTDVMEGVVGKQTVGGSEFSVPKNRPKSPKKAPIIPDRTTSASIHSKSASVPFLPLGSGFEMGDDDIASLKKPISVSNPSLATVSEDALLSSPSKSPSRSYRDSPLKHVKNKLSSILKSSKGLLASSAAISAEGKSSLLSPSRTTLGFHMGQSTESIVQHAGAGQDPLYPDLSHALPPPETQSRPASPARTNSRRTRASIEREKREAKEREKEEKEARRQAEQMQKLQKARDKEQEKARVFSKEQEKLAEMERQVSEQKELPVVPPPTSSPQRATRSSPRKAKPAPEDDIQMTDAPSSSMPPPSIPRANTGAARPTGIKRPVKPVKESASKAKQLPTVIRVNTTSSQHSQYHPSNSVLAATLQDTLGSQQHVPHYQLNSKASKASLQTKPSLQSLKSSISSTGRPKALEMAAKRKAEEEREAQRKREQKQEIERKRAQLQEEERREEQRRRAEEHEQREKEKREAAAAAEAKKSAQRQAAIERAKQTRAPPPAVRPQPAGAPEHGASQAIRPPSRMTGVPASRADDGSRPVNAILSNAAKSASKRPLQADEEPSRPQLARNAPSYQSKEAKRLRMSEELEDFDMDTQQQHPPTKVIKGAPVRPSNGFKKDLPNKSIFSNGYSTAPQNGPRDLFKAAVANQHTIQSKAAHPLDMAQVSKAAIPFAPNPNPAGPATHKTPARPVGMQNAKSTGKSAARSSPRFQNGDAIELPDIETDDEDEEDDAHIGVAAWADSPNLRGALMRQETIDPLAVFGPPGPLNMEEVFSKNKERWGKFRARTSSANWSGTDRLTEEEIRKDLFAREKMRKEGGWTYELSREMM